MFENPPDITFHMKCPKYYLAQKNATQSTGENIQYDATMVHTKSILKSLSFLNRKKNINIVK